MNLLFPGIADCLNNTENDILRAFRYWESNGLLKLEYDCEHTISGIELLQTGQSPANNISKESIPAIATTSKKLPSHLYIAKRLMQKLKYLNKNLQQHLAILCRTRINTLLILRWKRKS